MKKTVAIAALTLTAIAFGSDGGGGVRFELIARLMGQGEGKVDFKVDNRSERGAQLEAEGERLTPSTTYTLTIGTQAPILVTTNALGQYEGEMHFGVANEPTIAAGDAVTLVDATGVVVQSGVMAAK